MDRDSRPIIRCRHYGGGREGLPNPEAWINATRSRVVG